MLIRTATETDLDSLVAVEAAPDTAHWLAETGRDWHRRALADPDQEHLVAVVDGAIAGFVVLAGIRDPAHVVELRRIVIAAEHRGAGHGRTLLRTAVAHAYNTIGARRVWLDVKPTNRRAIALYRSEGFTAERTIPQALAEPDGSTSDLVVMTHSDQT